MIKYCKLQQLMNTKTAATHICSAWESENNGNSINTFYYLL